MLDVEAVGWTVTLDVYLIDGLLHIGPCEDGSFDLFKSLAESRQDGVDMAHVEVTVMSVRRDAH